VKYDALIIGAGPAGTTAALMLARAGWSVAIVEKKAFPRRKVCGEFISATSMPLLRELGVGDPFFELAGPEVRRVGLFANEAVLDSSMPQAAGSLPGWGRALGREHFDALLLEAAVNAGARLWQPWSASELRAGNHEYRCKIAAEGSEQELVARVVVGAYGSWQSGALPLQRVEPHKPSDLLAFKAHFTESELPVDLMSLLVFPGGYGGMVHSDSGRVSLSCCVRRDQLHECRRRYQRQRAGESVLEHIKASCLGVRQALQYARLQGAWLSAGPIRPGIRIRSTQDIFLVGNLAGEAHPIVAEGISMATQSAWLLSRRLIANQDDIVGRRGISEIQKEYASDWKASFGMRVRLAAVFAHLAMRPGATALLLPLLHSFPKILSVGAQLSGKTRQIVAERSPISRPARHQMPSGM
jgi:flavin-dependent dehydrogenase